MLRNRKPRSLQLLERSNDCFEFVPLLTQVVNDSYQIQRLIPSCNVFGACGEKQAPTFNPTRPKLVNRSYHTYFSGKVLMFRYEIILYFVPDTFVASTK